VTLSRRKSIQFRDITLSIVQLLWIHTYASRSTFPISSTTDARYRSCGPHARSDLMGSASVAVSFLDKQIHHSNALSHYGQLDTDLTNNYECTIDQELTDAAA